MPTYSFQCRSCGHQLDVQRPMGEIHPLGCPECGEALSRRYSPAVIVFKGTGFYSTDTHGGDK